MEGALTFLNCNTELLAKNLHAAVIGHLEVVDASHDTREIVVRRQRRLARLANHGEHGREILETYRM